MDKRKLTEHARARQRQRGISDMQIELIRAFGVDHYQQGGSHLCFIPEKKIAALRDALDKLGNVALMKGEADSVVTVMHVDRRIGRTRRAA